MIETYYLLEYQQPGDKARFLIVNEMGFKRETGVTTLDGLVELADQMGFDITAKIPDSVFERVKRNYSLCPYFSRIG